MGGAERHLKLNSSTLTPLHDSFARRSTDDGTIVVISVVNGDANTLSVYEDWETMVPLIISDTPAPEGETGENG